MLQIHPKTSPKNTWAEISSRAQSKRYFPLLGGGELRNMRLGVSCKDELAFPCTPIAVRYAVTAHHQTNLQDFQFGRNRGNEPVFFITL